MNFTLVTQKLKELMGVSQDYKVAEGLGLKRTAFQERKNRGSIPWKEIIAWCNKNLVSFDDNFSMPEGTSFAAEGRVKLIPLEGREMRIESLKNTAEKILRSNSPFAEALAHNIDTFSVGLDLWEKKEASHPIQKGQEGKT